MPLIVTAELRRALEHVEEICALLPMPMQDLAAWPAAE